MYSFYYIYIISLPGLAPHNFDIAGDLHGRCVDLPVLWSLASSEHRMAPAWPLAPKHTVATLPLLLW